MDDWTFTERVDRLLELAGEMDGLRLTRTGVNLEATFRWRIGEAITGSVADMDNDDYRSFLAAWRQLVMRSEPTHLPTILALCRSHLTDPKLRELATLVGDRLALVNRNDLGEERRTFTFTYGDKVYSPWEVADLFMHGAVFHGRDRNKREILESLSTGALAQLNYAFRMYVRDVSEAMHHVHA